MTSYDFDRFLKYDELTGWLHDLARQHPTLISLSSYGKSFQGRELWLVTISDSSGAQAAEDKPAHWVDANIHSVEVTAGVAACYLIHHLVSGHANGDSVIQHALLTRTFYVVPRVNPDGVESALGDIPVFQRSSVRPWPWKGHRYPGILEEDVDGNGEILMMRIRDEHGAWVAHPEDPRVMIPVDHNDSPVKRGDYSTPRFRLMKEGTIENYDGWTIPQPANPTGLDLNRNFPAGWAKEIKGSGENALSEVEIDCLVRAIAARPNICGYNAYHTNGGILLRPSSVRPDSQMSALDVWTFKEIGKKYSELTGNNVYSCYEDFTFDKSGQCMSGASDDYMYEHKGVFSWTTEFWDVIFHATGHHADTKIWYIGHTVEESLAIAKWAPPELYQDWKPFNHPQLGPVEIGGPNMFKLITNPPLHLLKQEISPHAEFAVHQALLSPKLEVLHHTVERLSMSSDAQQPAWLIKIGVANTGFLSTNISEMATKIKAVLPVAVEIANVSDGSNGTVLMLDGYSASRQLVGQLEGRLATRVNWSGSDGTPDRALCVWTIVAPEGSVIEATAFHQRAGRSSIKIVLN